MQRARSRVRRSLSRRRIALGGLGLILVLALGFSAWYRETYWAWPGQAASSRVHWCGRDYEIGIGAAQSWAQVTARTSGAVRPLGDYPPLGPQQEVFSTNGTAHGPGNGAYCPTVIYLRTGRGEYLPYTLQGGP